MDLRAIGALLLPLTLAAVDLPLLTAPLRSATAVAGAFRWVAAAGEVRRGSFIATQDGRYEVILRSSGDGGIDRWLSDGERHWQVTRLAPDEPADVRETRGDTTTRVLTAALRADLEALARDYLITPTEVDGGVRIQLTARSDGLPALIIVLANDGQPQRIELDDGVGGRFRAEVLDFSRAPTLDPTRFAAPGR